MKQIHKRILIWSNAILLFLIFVITVVLLNKRDYNDVSYPEYGVITTDYEEKDEVEAVEPDEDPIENVEEPQGGWLDAVYDENEFEEENGEVL